MRGLVITGLIAGQVAAGLPALAQSGDGHHSHYAGEHRRAIKSLSAEDIGELRRGGGWGLAKAAELNGVPGPAHLLELADEIGLSPDQMERITAIHDRMRARAKAEGERLIVLEERLEEHFRERTISDGVLRELLSKIAAVRAELRYVHLAAHLETPAILTGEQVARYRVLRGYE